MDLNKAIKLLKYHSKWIKGDINCIDELNPFDLLKAIEIIIKEINMNKEKELNNTPQILGGVKELVDDVIIQIKEDLETDNIEAIEGLLHLLCSKNNIEHMIEYLCCEEATKKYDKINIKQIKSK